LLLRHAANVSKPSSNKKPRLGGAIKNCREDYKAQNDHRLSAFPAKE